MSTKLLQYTHGRDNNFNLIRFMAAVLVLYSHSFVLTTGLVSTEPLYTSLGMSIGSISVDIFFITSGFLVSASWYTRNNLKIFALSRGLRILPALIVAVLFSSFIIGLYFSVLPYEKYLLNTDVYKFIFKNILLFAGIDYNLPGVFNNNPYPNAINGSLWSLPYEVKMYVCMVIISVLVTWINKKINIASTRVIYFYLAMIFLSISLISDHLGLYSGKFIHLFYMFFIGVAFYINRDKVPLNTIVFLVLFLILVLSSCNEYLFNLVYKLVIPYLVLFIAYVPSGVIRKFNRYGDYSYGIYIYAFPIQQAFVAVLPNIEVNEMMLYSFLTTMIFSTLSWRYIEKPSLSLKKTFLAKN